MIVGVNAPHTPTHDLLREQLREERERHDASLAQLEIVAEELLTAGEQLATTTKALSIAREDGGALRRQLRASMLEQHLTDARLAHLLSHSPTTLFEQDLDLRYVWACATPFGRRPDEVIGLLDGDLFSPEQAQALSAMKREVLRALRPARSIVDLTIDGAVRRTDIYLKPLEDERGAIAGVCGIATELQAEDRG